MYVYPQTGLIGGLRTRGGLTYKPLVPPLRIVSRQGENSASALYVEELEMSRGINQCKRWK